MVYECYVNILVYARLNNLGKGACGNIVPSKGICSADAVCEVSANGRVLLTCSCRDGFLGTGPVCQSKIVIL